jgi:hypothetical protein
MSGPRLCVFILIINACAAAQGVTLRGQVEVVHHSSQKSGNANVVVWLTPVFPLDSKTPLSPTRLVQKDKRFSPHVVAVRAGTEIEFPNEDPFFHDVFSIYHGRPFDLGLYESGTVRKVRFSQPGVSYIFCNIHPAMSAAVVAVPTPYFAVTSSDGSFQIGHLTTGRFRMEFWYELASEAELNSLARDVVIDAEPVPVTVTLHSSDLPTKHLNKYGQEYSAESPETY